MHLGGTANEDLTRENAQLHAQAEDLRAQLAEAKAALDAIRCGEVDALLIATPDGDRIYTQEGADTAYRVLVESMQQGAATLLENGDIFYSNRHLARLLKTPLQQLIGASLHSFVHPDDAPRYAALVREARRCSSDGEIRFVAADGALIPVYLAFNRLELGDRSGLCLSVTDLTPIAAAQRLAEANASLKQEVAEHKRTEEALRQSEEHYRTLFEAIDEGFCILEVAFDEHEEPIDMRYVETNPAFEKQTGLIKARGRSVRELVPDLEEQWFETYGRIALSGEPVRFEMRTEQLQRWYDVYAFRYGQPADRRVAIVFNDISNRKQMENVLRESEERFRLAARASGFGMYDHDFTTGQIYWSPELKSLIGLPLDTQVAFVPDDPMPWIHPEDRERVRQALLAAHDPAGSGLFEDEHRIIREEGAVRWVYVRGQALFDDEGGARRLVRATGIITDITERKEAEEELRRSEERFRHLIESSSVGIVICDVIGGVHYANPAAQAMLGYNGEEISRIDWHRLTPAEFAPLDARAVEQSLATGLCAPYEKELLARDGRRVPVLSSVSMIAQDGASPPQGAVFLTDLTRLKQTEEALRQSENFTRCVLDSMPAHVAVLDQDGVILQVNEAWKRFARENGAPVLAQAYGGLNYLELCRIAAASDDPAAVVARECLEKLTRLIQGDISRFELEYPCHAPNQERWFMMRAAPLAGGEGIVVAHIDITERKRAEAALRQSEARYRRLVQSIPVPLCVMNRNDESLYFNDRFTQVFGYTQADIPTLEDWWRRAYPDPMYRRAVMENWQAKIRRSAETGTETEPEELNVTRKDGTVRVVVISNLVIDDNVLATFIDVTERKQAEDELRRSEKRLRTLGDNIPAGAIYQHISQPDGGIRYAYMSAGIEQIVGMTSEQVLANPAAFRELIVEEDRPRCAAAEAQSARDLTPFDCEFRQRTLTGEVKWVQCRSTPRRLEEGSIVWDGVVTDITARKLVQQTVEQHSAELERRVAERTAELVTASEKIHAERQRFLDVLDTLPVIIDIIRPDHQIEWANRAFRESLGDNVGKLCYASQFGREAPCEECQAFVPLQTGRPHNWQWKLPNGRTFDIYNFPFADADGSPMILEMDIDITERKQAEEALREINETLERRVAERTAALAEADKRKDEFLAMLAHELRNPLAPVRNAVQVIRLAGDREDIRQRQQNIIDRQVTHMARLLDDLLDVSRVTRGKIELRLQGLDLTDVLAHAMETTTPLIETRRHKLHVFMPPASLRVKGDIDRLAQVVGNLLVNAAKYTNEGGQIWLSADLEEGQAVVRVRDNGTGISAELLPRVFDLFAQADHSLGRAQGGLGIGLTMVQSLVQMHGGTVEARSAGLGQGSEFIVRLAALAAEPAVSPDRSRPIASGSASATARRIMIVDDIADSAETLADLAALWGHEARAVHSGAAALEVARDFRPDVALLDIGMPGMDGYELARRLRAEHGQNMVLVAMTGYGQAQDREATRAAGFNHHLVKPVDLDVLFKLLTTSIPV